jgi:hypothetical protein
MPANLRTNPTYRKANPAAQPFMILALTSKTRTPGQIYDAVNNILNQRLLQVPGVGDVTLGGGSQPAVRVELDRLRCPTWASAATTCAPRCRPAALRPRAWWSWATPPMGACRC